MMPQLPVSELLPNEQFKRQKAQQIQQFYSDYNQHYEYWIQKNRYYYEQQARLLKAFIPKPGRVLEVGCGQGYFLQALQPQEGVGIDFVESHITAAQSKYPQYRFECLDILEVDQLDQQFDVVMMVNVCSELSDVSQALKKLQTVMHAGTRLIILEYSFLWEPLLRLAGVLKLRPKRPYQGWLSRSDFKNLFRLADYDLISCGNRILLPKKIPLAGHFFNSFLDRFPLFDLLGVSQFYITRPHLARKPKEATTATIVIPCKNEEGNIEEIVQRTPVLGAATEIIIVNDQSTDRTGTLALEQVEKYPEKHIRVVEGPGQGKGGACRAGFQVANNDVLLILDADMTVMPEDLHDFFEAITSGKGEYINGNRLMYTLEDNSMRLANFFGNKAFAMLFSLILRQPIKDTLCGTKVVFREDYDKICETREFFKETDIWGDYDWIFGAARYNLKFLELPVHYRERTAGTTKMVKRLKNAVTMLKMCYLAFLKIFLR